MAGITKSYRDYSRRNQSRYAYAVWELCPWKRTKGIKGHPLCLWSILGEKERAHLIMDTRRKGHLSCFPRHPLHPLKKTPTLFDTVRRRRQRLHPARLLHPPGSRPRHPGASSGQAGRAGTLPAHPAHLHQHHRRPYPLLAGKEPPRNRVRS